VVHTMQRCATRSRARGEVGDECEAMIGDAALAVPMGGSLSLWPLVIAVFGVFGVVVLVVGVM
jgi:hypothetical protein